MVNRDNYQAVRRYLAYLAEVRQNDPMTLRNRRSQLRLVLEWADETPLERAPSIRPSFPHYLRGADIDGDGKPVTAEYAKRVCKVVQAFFTWLRESDRSLAREIPRGWIETLIVTKAGGRVREREFYSLEDVRRIVALPCESVRQRRDQAAAAFLFLSGMRVGAFVTMPIESVSLTADPPSVRQWPDLGVQTKNRKAATTYLLQIPDLLEVVRSWDAFVRARLPRKALWYATIDIQGALTGSENTGTDRRRKVGMGLRELCERAGVEYHSVHKLRHGFTMHALQGADNISDLKAISQNLMHSSLTITDQVYGVLAGDDVANRIAALGSNTARRPAAGVPDNDRLLDALAEKLLARLGKAA